MARKDEDDRAAADPAWGALATEARHPESLRLDRSPASEVVALLLAEDRRGIERAELCVEAIARAAEWVAEAVGAGGSVVFAGAGTSGRLGVLEAAECPPTFGTDPQRIRALLAGGDDAVFRAREGAEDREDEGRKAVDGLGAADLVIAISASSVTPYARGALARARELGTRTILLTCAAPSGLDSLADLLIALETGPEILTGSTRLKAGSATKAALNAITTAAMVRSGKTYENLMVDLRVGSAKLRDRALRIVGLAGRVDREEAERLLNEAGAEVKTAIVMARLGVDAGAARARIEGAAGHLWHALGEQNDTADRSGD